MKLTIPCNSKQNMRWVAVLFDCIVAVNIAEIENTGS